MALVASVTDGTIDSTTSTTSSTSSASNDLGYDEFLQILCAEMQYQDPLEPTSNTEYIAQLATFSQLESILDMNNTVTTSMANDLVGKYVILKTTSSTTGETSYIAGVVDYVMYEDGETYVSVNDGLYSIDDLDTVADADYMEAVTLAQTFASMIALLPSTSSLTTSDASDVEAAREFYDALTSYQQSFIDSDDLDTLEELEEQLETLLGTSSSDSTEETDTTEETDESDSSDTTTD